MNAFRPSRSEDALQDLPKHERLRAFLLQELSEGRLRPGDSLPTEFELAASAKISRNTVRQALASLEQLGLIFRVRGRGTFVHDSAIQRLKSEQGGKDGLNIFALVIPDSRGGYYPSLQRGFGEVASEGHNQMLVCDTDNDLFRQADALLQLLDKKVAGLAIVPATARSTPSHHIRPLREKGIPLVFCHRRAEGIQAPLVSFSGTDVGRVAGHALVERGHRRIAFFTPSRVGLAVEYEHGLRDALRQHGLELQEKFIRSDEASLTQKERDQRLAEHLDAILEGSTAATAIFCSFDTEAELLYLMLNQRGIKIPQEISLIGFGGAWREGAVTRRLVSVTVDEEALGRKAAALLTEMCEGKRALDDEQVFLLPLNLSDGETLGRAPLES
jgi:GntR family transcriptional regulator of arabinose operon